jgi:Domain of unknown function (DUF4331)
MKTLKLTLPLLALTGLVLAGCPSDDAPPGETESTSDDPTTTNGPTTNPMMTTTTDPDTTVGSMDTTATAGETEMSGTTEPEPGPFVFEEAPPEDYTQVDRKGFPAINTGLNLLGDKDAYNAASPADDAALMFASNIFESLETLHLGAPGMQTADNTGLDDDLLSLGLEPCVTPPLPMDNCDDQGGPFAIPDTLTLDLDDPSVFPNGRGLDFPVMDVIFAVLLLDLGTHDVTTFLDLDGDGTFGPSLNPLANDMEFAAEFPYLAPAHE